MFLKIEVINVYLSMIVSDLCGLIILSSTTQVSVQSNGIKRISASWTVQRGRQRQLWMRQAFKQEYVLGNLLR